jgi:hypothetical protein
VITERCGEVPDHTDSRKVRYAQVGFNDNAARAIDGATCAQRQLSAEWRSGDACRQDHAFTGDMVGNFAGDASWGGTSDLQSIGVQIGDDGIESNFDAELLELRQRLRA